MRRCRRAPATVKPAIHQRTVARSAERRRGFGAKDRRQDVAGQEVHRPDGGCDDHRPQALARHAGIGHRAPIRHHATIGNSADHGHRDERGRRDEMPVQGDVRRCRCRASGVRRPARLRGEAVELHDDADARRAARAQIDEDPDDRRIDVRGRVDAGGPGAGEQRERRRAPASAPAGDQRARASPPVRRAGCSRARSDASQPRPRRTAPGAASGQSDAGPGELRRRSRRGSSSRRSSRRPGWRTRCRRRAW